MSGFCITCRHVEVTDPIDGMSVEYRCCHPRLVSPVDGSNVNCAFTRMRVMRGPAWQKIEKDVCGHTDADLWERREA